MRVVRGCTLIAPRFVSESYDYVGKSNRHVIVGVYMDDFQSGIERDLKTAEELIQLIIDKEPNIPVSNPEGDGLTYLMSRQVRSLKGLSLLCKSGNDHSAAIILRTVIEDFLLIWYFEQFDDAKDSWSHARVAQGIGFMEQLKSYYERDSVMSSSIAEYQDFLRSMQLEANDVQKWNSRLKQRMNRLRDKLKTMDIESTKQLFIYDVLYQRFSGWVHANGVELGRYVQHHSDDYFSMYLDSSPTLTSEILYNAVQLVGASFIKYLVTLHATSDEFSELPIVEVDEWLHQRLEEMSFVNQNLTDV